MEIRLENKNTYDDDFEIDEVVKESNKTKSENTKLKLHLQVILLNFIIIIMENQNTCL